MKKLLLLLIIPLLNFGQNRPNNLSSQDYKFTISIDKLNSLSSFPASFPFEVSWNSDEMSSGDISWNTQSFGLTLSKESKFFNVPTTISISAYKMSGDRWFGFGYENLVSRGTFSGEFVSLPITLSLPLTQNLSRGKLAAYFGFIWRHYKFDVNYEVNEFDFDNSDLYKNGNKIDNVYGISYEYFFAKNITLGLRIESQSNKSVIDQPINLFIYNPDLGPEAIGYDEIIALNKRPLMGILSLKYFIR